MERYLGLLALVLVAQSALPATPAITARCAQVTDRPAFGFQGKTLHETPDITAKELRRANALLSAGCREDSIQLANDYGRGHPEDFRMAFLSARYAWTAGNTRVAEAILKDVLAKHPDFLSAQVLLASLYAEIPEHRNESRALLADLAVRSPTDLWVYMARKKMEAAEHPSRTLTSELLAIARDARFPPTARDTAIALGNDLPNLTEDEFIAFARAHTEYDSSPPMACKINRLASRLILFGRRYDEVRELLESPKAQAADCMAVEGNRIMLALTYLIQAARVSPTPGPANAALVAKARDTLRGDWSEMATYIMRPGYEALAPFIANEVPVSKPDKYGRTQLCHAAMTAAAEIVQVQLKLGADPNGHCEGNTLIRYMMRSASDESYRVERQREIVRLLLAAGARATPEDIADCESGEANLRCKSVFMPVIRP